MYRQYVICSNPSCKFSAQGNELIFKNCPMCGKDIIHKCPECGESITQKNAMFCQQCRAALKPQPEEKKNLPRNKGNT